jgi:hypothetical protein
MAKKMIIGDTPARMAEQLKEMLGEDNAFFAGLTLGRPPDDREKVRHYLANGGAEDFARRHRDDFLKEVEVEEEEEDEI